MKSIVDNIHVLPMYKFDYLWMSENYCGSG